MNRKMELNNPADIVTRLRNPLMLLKGDYERAADLIESLQRALLTDEEHDEALGLPPPDPRWCRSA